jgi:hypoxanthine phosphoribosyltransferase
MTQQQTLKVMISEEQLAERIQALGAEIQAHYNGQPVAVIGVLKGCFLFLADLCRELHEDVTIDFLRCRATAAPPLRGWFDSPRT